MSGEYNNIKFHVDRLVQEFQYHGRAAAEQMFQDVVFECKLTRAMSAALATEFQKAIKC